MEFHDNQWYKGRNGKHPVCGVWVPNKDDPTVGEIHWWQLGVHTFLPQYASFHDFASYIAYLDSPMTEEQVHEYAMKAQEYYENQRQRV